MEMWVCQRSLSADSIGTQAHHIRGTLTQTYDALIVFARRYWLLSVLCLSFFIVFFFFCRFIYWFIEFSLCLVVLISLFLFGSFWFRSIPCPVVTHRRYIFFGIALLFLLFSYILLFTKQLSCSSCLLVFHLILCTSTLSADYPAGCFIILYNCLCAQSVLAVWGTSFSSLRITRRRRGRREVTLPTPRGSPPAAWEKTAWTGSSEVLPLKRPSSPVVCIQYRRIASGHLI